MFFILLFLFLGFSESSFDCNSMGNTFVSMRLPQLTSSSADSPFPQDHTCASLWIAALKTPSNSYLAINKTSLEEVLPKVVGGGNNGNCSVLLPLYACAANTWICEDSRPQPTPICPRLCSSLTKACTAVKVSQALNGQSCPIPPPTQRCYDVVTNNGSEVIIKPQQQCTQLKALAQQQVDIQPLPKCDLKIMYMYWISHQISTTVASILLEEIYGCNMTYSIISQDLRNTMSVVDFLAYISFQVILNVVAFDIEQWVPQNNAVVANYLAQGLVHSAGEIGYTGSDGMYIANNGNVTHYMQLRNASLTQSLFQSRVYVQLYGVLTMTVMNLRLQVAPVLLSSAEWVDVVERAIEEGVQPLLFTAGDLDPYLLQIRSRVKRLQLPPVNKKCLDMTLGIGDPANYDCDYPYVRMWKSLSSTFVAQYPSLLYFMNHVELTRGDMLAMIGNITNVFEDDVYRGVCDWLVNNADTWRPWLGPPKSAETVPNTDNAALAAIAISVAVVGGALLGCGLVVWVYWVRYRPYTAAFVVRAVKDSIDQFHQMRNSSRTGGDDDDPAEYLLTRYHHNNDDDSDTADFISLVMKIREYAQQLCSFVPLHERVVPSLSTTTSSPHDTKNPLLSVPPIEVQLSSSQSLLYRIPASSVIVVVRTNAVDFVVVELLREVAMDEGCVWFFPGNDGAVYAMFETTVTALTCLSAFLTAFQDQSWVDDKTKVGVGVVSIPPAMLCLSKVDLLGNHHNHVAFTIRSQEIQNAERLAHSAAAHADAQYSIVTYLSKDVFSLKSPKGGDDNDDSVDLEVVLGRYGLCGSVRLEGSTSSCILHEKEVEDDTPTMVEYISVRCATLSMIRKK